MIATAFECFEIRAKAFEKKHGFLPPGKDSPTPRPYNAMKIWEQFEMPCLCGKEIPDDWNDK